MLSFLLTFITVPLFSSSVLASRDPLLYPYSLVQRRSNLPSGWSHLARHNPASILPLRFGLSQSNINDIEQLLLDVSHPESPNYGNHWTPSQVADKFKPSYDTISAVHNWLVKSGIDKDRIRLSPSTNWIELNATVEEAEGLLQTEYHVYEHQSGTKHVACESYHLPQHVTPHVDLVTPTIDFTVMLGKRGSQSGGPSDVGKPGYGLHPKTKGGKLDTPNVLPTPNVDNCDQQITLSCLRSLYNFNYQPVSPLKNSFAIVEYTPQAYVPSDLDLFASTFAPTLVGKRPVLKSIDGGSLVPGSGFDVNGESDLDLEYAMGLVTAAQPVTLYQVGDAYEGATFNNMLDALDGSYCKFEGGDNPLYDGIYPDPSGYNKGPDCGTIRPANVISTSYGFNEADVSPAYAIRQCDEYAKLGLMGVTVIYSSGDNGVAGNGGVCLNPDGSESASGTLFNPTFPSVCPYVTSIGATQVNPGSPVTAPESACEQVIFSGGGFSNVFKVPDYQKQAVGGWLHQHRATSSPGLWNSTGHSRAYPDVSANGANYVTAVDGGFYLAYGTSASAPVVGSMLAMINDARITIHKKPIGFINPTIYSGAFCNLFKDITSGNNPGCGTNGFSAVQGWDPVTGLGTIDFQKLMAAFKKLP